MIKVAAISYLNSIPFIYGLKNSNVYSDIILSKDYPSKVADSLLNDEVDIIFYTPVASVTSGSSGSSCSSGSSGSSGSFISFFLREV